MVGNYVETVAAASNPAEAIGYVVGLLLLPTIGLVLLVVGLVKWSQSRTPQSRTPQSPPPVAPMQGYPGGPQPGQPYYAPQQGFPGPGIQGPQGFQPGYPAPAPKRRGVALIVTGAVVLALGVLGGLGVAATKVAEHAGGGDLAVGDCITDTAYEKRDVTAEAIACDDENALFEVAAKVDASSTCPDGKLEDSGYAVLLNSTKAVCFVPNLKRGSCYTVDVEGNNFHPADCRSTDGLVVRVDDVVDGSTDASKCSIPEAGLAFPEPARVLCLGPVG